MLQIGYKQFIKILNYAQILLLICHHFIFSFIGQKGIGFKSVFRVTDRPEIHSNNYHIHFDVNSGPMGYILPHWVIEAMDKEFSGRYVVIDVMLYSPLEIPHLRHILPNQISIIEFRDQFNIRLRCLIQSLILKMTMTDKINMSGMEFQISAGDVLVYIEYLYDNHLTVSL